MTAYYNEFDPHPAAWLRELIKEGLIAPGDVDERSIEDVTPMDIQGYTQCHFFAGIGGWSYALRLAGWPDDRPVWSGSCPCQPFSAAGKSAGFDDERHLWPAWYWLISQCKPGLILGEQVSSKDALIWFDLVSSDLESAGYAVGAVDTCAASVGAFHIRQRLYFVADAKDTKHKDSAGAQGLDCATPTDPDRCISEIAQGESGRGCCSAIPLGHTISTRREGHGQLGNLDGASGRPDEERFCPTAGFWDDVEWLPCRDGKSRPAQRGIPPLAFRLPERVGRGSHSSLPIDANNSTEARVMRLRGYGNSIVPQLAAEFIKAYLEASNGNATPQR